jgi:hypothetical protein
MVIDEHSLHFAAISGFPGLRKAQYRLPATGEELLILEVRPNVFQVIPAAHPSSPGETVVVIQKDATGATLLGLLLDWLTTPPKQNCYTITVIVQWPDGHTEIDSSRHCD